MTTRSILWSVLVGVSVLLYSADTTLAQGVGGIGGTVMDSSGAVLPVTLVRHQTVLFDPLPEAPVLGSQTILPLLLDPQVGQHHEKDQTDDVEEEPDEKPRHRTPPPVGGDQRAAEANCPHDGYRDQTTHSALRSDGSTRGSNSAPEAAVNLLVGSRDIRGMGQGTRGSSSTAPVLPSRFPEG